MEEGKGELNKTQSGISRRDFLKKGALIGAGLVTGGTIINAGEVNAIENGISSGSGLFIPLYETHYKGLNVDRIPNDLDVLFREVPGKMDSAKDLLSGETSAYINRDKKVRIFPVENLQKIATIGSEIMVGDVWAEPSSFSLNIAEGGTEFLTGLGISLVLLRDSLKGKRSVVGSNITRRKFLKGAAKTAMAVGASWLMAPGIYTLLRGGPKIGTVAADRENALSRIIDRIYGMQSDIHPEMLENGIFRNLLMADKMLTVAEDFEKRTGKKAKVGFQVEYGHSGIEDFLRLGHDVCRWIIERYPRSVLKFVADQNGGKESLWTARLFKLPKDFSPGPNADWSEVTERKVVDIELQKALESKLI